MEGYFKVHRKILDSQVFAHQTALKIWVWCMAKVTFKERFISLKIGKGDTTVKLLPGQFIFGRFKAEEELNIDGSTIYKWIQKFASPEFNMIIIESNNQYSIITLCNWEQYQNGDEEEVTTKEQPSNNQVTAAEQPSNTNKNDNKDKKVNNEKNTPPAFENFKVYALENNPEVNLQALELKYKSWVENNWRDGNNKKIVNWKSKLLNTIPYLKNKNDGSNRQYSGRNDKRVNDMWNKAN